MNDINYNITSLIDILGLVQGAFLGIILVIEGLRQKAKLLLGFFLIVFSAELITAILDDLNILEQHPELLFLPLNFYYLVIPLFYLYVRSASNYLPSKRKIFFILLPGIIEFIIYLILFLQNSTQKISLIESNITNICLLVLELFSIPYSLYFAFITIKYINKHKENVENYYSDTQGKLLVWAKAVIILLLTYNLFLILSIFIEGNFFSEYLYPIMSAINVIFIFWIGISGIRQSQLFESQNLNSSEETNTTLISTETNNNNQFYSKLIDLMTQDELYLEPNISLADVSKKLKISQRNLSELIRENSGKNFNQFINHYRVKEAKKLLLDPSNDNLNMLGIAYDAGFNSKASFYSVFKKFTSQTPTSFKNNGLTQ